MTTDFNYEIEQLNNYYLEVKIDTSCDSRLLNMIFRKSMPKLKKKGISLGEDQTPDRIGSFEVIPQFLKVMQRIIKPFMDEVANQTFNDGIIITNYNLRKSYFLKGVKTWRIYFEIEAEFRRK